MQMARVLGGRDGARSLRARKDFFTRQYQLDRAMRRALETRRDSVPGSLVAELYAHWGDPLSQGAENFLRSCLAATTACRGDVLQCGASLATLLLGAACARTDGAPRHLWCLEHDGHWANVIRSWLTQYGVTNAHVIVAPARLFDNYTWYGMDTTRLPATFGLALCDGARATPRGVVGLAERMADKLTPDCVVLARNVVRTADQDYLNRWAATRGAGCVLVDRGEGFVKITSRNVAELSPV